MRRRKGGKAKRMAVRSLSTALARDGDSDDEVNAERRLRVTRRKETKTRNEGLRERGGPEFKRTMGWRRRRRESAREDERGRGRAAARMQIFAATEIETIRQLESSTRTGLCRFAPPGGGRDWQLPQRASELNSIRRVVL